MEAHRHICCWHNQRHFVPPSSPCNILGDKKWQNGKCNFNKKHLKDDVALNVDISGNIKACVECSCHVRNQRRLVFDCGQIWQICYKRTLPTTVNWWTGPVFNYTSNYHSYIQVSTFCWDFVYQTKQYAKTKTRSLTNSKKPTQEMFTQVD